MKIFIILLLLFMIDIQSVTAQSERISKTATIVLRAPYQKVFPLFGPVREMEWAEGWNPDILYGNSEAEGHMIFRTKPRYDDEDFYTWIISKWSPDQKLIEYSVSSKDRVWFITIQFRDLEKITEADVTYTFTGFNADAIRKNRESLERMYSEELKDWEGPINNLLSSKKNKH